MLRRHLTLAALLTFAAPALTFAAAPQWSGQVAVQWGAQDSLQRAYREGYDRGVRAGEVDGRRGDGFRFQDLMRWAKRDYMNTSNKDIWRGAKVPDNGAVLRDAEGYITPYTAATANRTFLDPKNYLQPIPSGQIALYPAGNLSQNPGWQ